MRKFLEVDVSRDKYNPENPLNHRNVARSFPRFGFSQQLPPSTCPDCGAKLGATTYGHVRPRDGEVFYRLCACGCRIEWAFPNVWKRRHIVPIFDAPSLRTIIQDTDGNHAAQEKRNV